MIEKLFPLKFPPGFYRNGTKYEAKGRWFDGNLVRFYEGAIRPVQGWRVALDANNASMPTLAGIPRTAFGWRSATGEVEIAVGTTEELYVIKDGTANIVTPSDFDPGAENASSGAGNGDFGNGEFGAGLFGVGRAPLAAQLTEADTWQLDAFGDTLVACCTHGGRIYVWTGDVEVLADVAAGSPEPCRGVVITPERFLMALGAEDDVRKVMWASQGSTIDWTASDSNTAGDFTLTTQGRIMCGRRTPAQTLIFTDADLHSANYTGGEFVYSFKQEGDNCGIVSPQAVAIVDTSAIWMGRDNFYGYDGFVKPIPCSVHDYVFDDFNEQQASKVFACPVSEFGEVWFFYPSAGAVENDRYVVYNYRENHWTTGTLSRTCAIDRGAVPNPVMFDGLGTIYTHEVGAGAHTVPLSVLGTDTLLDSDAVALEAHVGLVWDQIAGSLVFASNALKRDGATEPRYIITNDVHSADYEFSAKVHLTAGPYPAANFGGVGARMAGLAGYFFGVRTEASPVYVLRGRDAADAALFTELTAPVPAALLDTDVKLTIRVVGTTIVGFANGIAVLTTSNAALATGQPGLAGGFPFTEVIDPSDSFTDTDATFIEDHTPDAAFVWNDDDGALDHKLVINSNALRSVSDGTTGVYRADGLAAVDEMTMNIEVTSVLTTHSQIFSAILRAATPILATSGWYRGQLFIGPTGAGQFEGVTVTIYRNAVSVATLKIDDSALMVGTHALRLRVEAGDVILSLDGTDHLTYTDGTPLTGTGAGVHIAQGGQRSNVGLASVIFGPAIPVDSNESFVGSAEIIGQSAEQAGDVDAGNAAVSASGEMALIPFLESGPVELGDGDNVFKVQRIVPDEKNLGDVRARFFTALYPTEAEVERGPYTLANPTAVRFVARQVRLRLEQVVETNWRIGTTRLGIIQGGRR